MRQIAIMVAATAVLCSPAPATAQGFQYGAERGSWDIQFDKRGVFPCYRWSSYANGSHFHPDDQWSRKARSARLKHYAAERHWDEGGYWLDSSGWKRYPRCIGLWQSQR